MVIYAGLVVGHGKVLAEYSTITGNYISVALKIIKSMNRTNRNVFSDHGQYVFNVKLNKSEIAFISLASISTDLQLQNLFLDQMETQFEYICHGNPIVYNDYSMNDKFSDQISDLMASYNYDDVLSDKPRRLDRQMTNIHLSLVTNDDLVITQKSIVSHNFTAFPIIIKRIRNQIIYRKKNFIAIIMIFVLILISIFLLYSNLYVSRRLF